MCGIDEVGRGALAGPVMAGCVHISPALFEDDLLSVIDDSKSLTPKKRDSIYEKLKDKEGIEWSTGEATSGEIDRRGIVEAANEAARRAIDKVSSSLRLRLVLADAGLVPDLDLQVREVKGGDTKSVHIAAASVMAKVSRDRLMEEKAKDYPGYGWAKNFGYGTKEHRSAIEKRGRTPLHRESFG